jgi:hypothetical protein
MKAHHLINRIPGNTAADPHYADALGGFTQKLARALAKLKRRLQGHYERAHPTELVRRAIAEAEACAWELSPYPHLFLPDLVEVRIAALVAWQPASARSEAACAPTE